MVKTATKQVRKKVAAAAAKPEIIKTQPLPKRGWVSRLRQLAYPVATEPGWRALPYLLLLALILRVLVGLSGDFVVHPDEIMQYLEPAHRVVFGSGITYWEMFYGGRSWLLPGVVAGILWLCKLIGLGSTAVYVPVVKIFFCVTSLLIPWGTYHFTRARFNENSARLALLLTCLWPFFIGFAHKPLTEFVATGMLLGGMALATMPFAQRDKGAALVGFILALTAFVRFQYAPLALLAWLVFLVDKPTRIILITITASTLAAIFVAGVEWYTWGWPYKSYYLNLMFNLIKSQYEPADYVFYFPRLVYMTAGLALLAVWAFGRQPRRYWLPAIMVLIILILHTQENHKEVRYIFVLIPLCLIICADWIDGLAGRAEVLRHWVHGVTATYVLVFSVLVLGNIIPGLRWLHSAQSHERGEITFLRKHSSIWSIYRDLATRENVAGVLHIGDPYFNTPGYYYLNRNIPFYDFQIEEYLNQGIKLNYLVSHIVTKNDFQLEGFTVVRDEGDYLLLESNRLGEPIIEWDHYEILQIGVEEIVAEVFDELPEQRPNKLDYDSLER